MGERERICALMKEAALDWLILSSPDSICHATGLVEPIETGPSPFIGGPTLAVLGRDGTLGFAVANGRPVPDADALATFPGFHWADPVDIDAVYRSAIVQLAGTMAIGGRVGYERRSAPFVLTTSIEAIWVAVDGELARARAIKSVREIACLTRSAQTAAHGQEAALLHSRAGRSELEVFAAIRGAMEVFAGARLPVAGDYLTGAARTAGAGGWPIGRIIMGGDPVICDLAPRVAGYWGDSCGSFAVETPSPAFRRLFAASHEALSVALDIMRPGLPIADLDARLRAVVARHGFGYPHHSGHAIGTSVHEWPRIVPYETATLQENMVMMVEPSAYDPGGGGARLEYMVLVERDGCRPLAPFPHQVAV